MNVALPEPQGKNNRLSKVHLALNLNKTHRLIPFLRDIPRRLLPVISAMGTALPAIHGPVRKGVCLGLGAGRRALVHSAQALGTLFLRGTVITFFPGLWRGSHPLLLLPTLGPKLLSLMGRGDLAGKCACVPVLGVLPDGVLAMDLIAPALFAVFPESARSIFYMGRAVPLFAAYLYKKLTIKLKPMEHRVAMWAEFHKWGAESMASMIEDFGGFYRKVGQIMGTAAQMMPPEYIYCFSRTMDNNPPLHIVKVMKLVEASFNRELGEMFSSFNTLPTATASVAQVHFGALKDHREVAIKVQICKRDKMVQDVYNMLKTTYILKALHMDGGTDLPCIMRAYTHVINDEFDFTIEASKLLRFQKMFEEIGLSEKVVVPRPIPELISEKTLVMERMRGVKLIDLLNMERAPGELPTCPPEVVERHLARGLWQGGKSEWEGFFNTLHKAWGYMTLVEGTFHTDPHPGNILLLPDGKIGLLDFGQTKTLKDKDRLWLCRLVLAMCAEDYSLTAELVRDSHKYCTGPQFMLENPTLEALNAIAFTYFDTRWTPLAKVNVFDMNNSPMMKNRILRNTEEGFMVVRVGYLMRGLMTACKVETSMVLAWEPYARLALQRAGELPPSGTTTWLKRSLSKAKIAYAKLSGHEGYTEIQKQEALISQFEDADQLAPWNYM